MAAPFAELQARSGDEIPHGAGNEDFTSTSQIGDPCCGIHGYTTNVIAPHLNLSGMKAAAHFDPQRFQFLDD